ncbi:MAG: hypothetical protein JNM53_17005 [Gemmatimonadetes bacterium]|nr:hypothetical protein [Gemmatimonadota bacterium]
MRTPGVPPLLLLLALACAPVAHPGGTSSAAQAPAASYVVRVTTGDREGVEVDWAIFPDESWPLEGRRDRTPFQLDLPAGRVAALLRPTRRTGRLEVTILRREPDGTLRRLGTSASLPIAVVVADRASEPPAILGPDSAPGLGTQP